MKNINFKILIPIILLIVIAILGFIFFKMGKKVAKVNPVNPRKYFILQSQSGNNPGKEGVIDKDGNVILEPIYDTVVIPDLAEPVFVVSDGENNFKLLNDKKEEIFKGFNNKEPVIGNSKNVNNNYRAAIKYKKDGKFGLLNIKGKEILKPIYEEITTVEDDTQNYKVKKDGKFGLVDDEGNTLLNSEFSEIKSANKTAWNEFSVKPGYIISKITNKGPVEGFSDINGNILISPKYEDVEKLEIPGDDYYMFVQDAGKKGLYKNTKQILPTTYQELSYSKKNIIIKKDGKYGMTTLEGKEVISPRFTSYNPQDNFVAFTDADKEYVYDEHGNQVGKGVYKIISSASNKNYIIVENYSGERMAVNGDKQLNEGFIDITYAFDDKFIFFKNDKYGVASFSKGIEVKESYDYITPIQGTKILEARTKKGVELYDKDLNKIQFNGEFTLDTLKNKVMVMQNDKERKYINLDGKEVDVVKELDLPAYPFKENGKYGFKKKSGEVVVKAEYDMVSDFNEYNFASVKKNGKWGSINSKFELDSKLTYDFNSSNLVPKFIGKYIIDDENSLFAIDLPKDGKEGKD